MRTALIILFLSPMLCTFAQKESTLLRQGNKSYNSGKYKEAEKDYRKALEVNKESVKGQFNLGDALYQQKNFQESTNIFGSLTEKNIDKSDKADVYYNLGNSLLEAKEYEKSIAAYKQSLLNNPSNIDTKYNLEYARMMLKKQQQQQQQKQDQKKDQQNKKDQQQQQDKNQQNQPPDQKKISKEDAERMLEAMKNDEKKTMDKVKKQKAKAIQVGVEKDW